jgi:hypothetical protein
VKIKAGLVSLLLIFLGTGGFIEPSHAIFGLSKCEKAKKAIKEEEAIGYELWKDFDKARDQVTLKSSFKEGLEVSFDLVPMLSSRIKVYDIVEVNKSCFTAKKVASARNLRIVTSDNVVALTKIKKLAPEKTEVIANLKMTPELWAALKTWGTFTRFLSQK